MNEVKDKIEDILLNVEAYYETIDFGITGGAKPVKVDSDTITYHSLNNRDVKTTKAFLRQNQIKTDDGLLPYNQFLNPAAEYFFDLSKKDTDYFNQVGTYKNSLYQLTIVEQRGVKVLHTRKSLGLLDLSGKIGGVFELLVLFFGVALVPFSKHSFSTAMLNKFSPKGKVGCCDSLTLFSLNNLAPCCKGCCGRSGRVKKLLKKQAKLDEKLAKGEVKSSLKVLKGDDEAEESPIDDDSEPEEKPRSSCCRWRAPLDLGVK